MTEREKLKPWRWPGEWVRQESFWRDVGTRTLGGLFAGVLLYVGAVMLGYVSRPDVWPLVLTTAAVGLWVSLVMWAMTVYDRRIKSGETKPPRFPSWVRTGLRVLEGVLALVLLIGLVTGKLP
jgi:L-asparagine transporter-like permease